MIALSEMNDGVVVSVALCFKQFFCSQKPLGGGRVVQFYDLVQDVATEPDWTWEI